MIFRYDECCCYYYLLPFLTSLPHNALHFDLYAYRHKYKYIKNIKKKLEKYVFTKDTNTKTNKKWNNANFANLSQYLLRYRIYLRMQRIRCSLLSWNLTMYTLSVTYSHFPVCHFWYFGFFCNLSIALDSIVLSSGFFHH